MRSVAYRSKKKKKDGGAVARISRSVISEILNLTTFSGLKI